MSNIKTILITGGAGFIGSNLCEFLIEKSYQIICIDNFDEFYPKEIKQKNIQNLLNNSFFNLIEGDIRDHDLLNTIFSRHKIDCVIHLAAKAGVRNSIDKPEEYFDVNLNGSICLLNIMKKHKVRNLIFASSSSVYGNKSGKLLETDSCNSPISPYAVTKRSFELLSKTYNINSKFNVINLRLFSIYGQNQRPDLVLFKFMNKILDNQPIEVFGNSHSTRDYTYIGDVLPAFHNSVLLLERNCINLFEIINVGNNRPVSLSELINRISETLNIEQVKIINRSYVQGDVMNTHADIKKAEKLLGYKPQTTIEEGVKIFSDWFKHHHYPNLNQLQSIYED